MQNQTNPSSTEPSRDRAFLLVHPRRRRGLILRGPVGTIVGPSGVGKTFAITQLAVSVASGRPWLGHFEIAPESRVERVLLVQADESAEEVHRRLHAITQSLTAEERAHVAARLVVVALGGESCTLVAPGTNGRSVETAELVSLRRRVQGSAMAPDEWALVLLDPLERLIRGPIGSGAIGLLASLTGDPAGARDRPAVLAASTRSPFLKAGMEVALSPAGSGVRLTVSESGVVTEELRLERGTDGVLSVRKELVEDFSTDWPTLPDGVDL